MSELSFDNNKTPLCEKHASDLEYAIQPQCQFCLTDKLSEYMLHGLEKYDDYEKLKAENEELKKRNESLLRDLDILVNVTPKEYRDMAREIREEGGEV